MSDDSEQKSNPQLHHTGLTVADLGRSVDFYTGVLDCTIENRFSVSGDAFGTVVGREGVSGQFVHLDVGGKRLELVEYDPAGSSRSLPTLPQPGAAHLAFSVDDVDAFVDTLPGTIEPLNEPQTTESGTRLVFVRDPDGNLIELLEG